MFYIWATDTLLRIDRNCFTIVQDRRVSAVASFSSFKDKSSSFSNRKMFFFLSLSLSLNHTLSHRDFFLHICLNTSIFLLSVFVWRSLFFLSRHTNSFYLLLWVSLSLFLWSVEVSFFFKWAIHGLFFLFSSFQQLTVNMFIINFAIGWIRTTDLWYWKRPLCQLSHNQCPQRSLSFSLIRTLFLCLSLVRSLSISLPPFCLTELVPNS